MEQTTVIPTGFLDTFQIYQWLQEHPLISILLLILPLFLVWRRVVKPSQSSSYEIPPSILPLEPLKSQIREFTKAQLENLVFTEAIWSVGMSEKSASVSEEDTLRLLEFIPPGVKLDEEFLEALLIKAMMQPTQLLDESTDDLTLKSMQRKPKIVALLPNEFINENIKNSLEKRMKSLGVRVTTFESLRPEMDELVKKRRAELFHIQKEAQKKNLSESKEAKVEFIAAPARGCFQCKMEIVNGKPNQCSACKAIIYCSADCAKKDWPMHKQLCSSFKSNISHATLWKMHSFPFTFYPEGKHFSNYNQVALLVKNGVHNVGIFKRLCSCYQNAAFGELFGERFAQLEAANITDAFERFETLGLSKEWFPLSAKISNPRKIVGWKELYEAKNLPLDNVGALAFDHAMTLWHILNKYLIDSIPVSKGRKTINIHLLGTESEADVVETFEILLGLVVNTNLCIHMIGPAISPRLALEHRMVSYHSKETDSNLIITLNSALYTPEHYDGSKMQAEFKLDFGIGKPDAVIILNGSLLGYETWVPVIKHLIDQQQKAIFTDAMEQGVDGVAKNIPNLGGRLSLESTCNPFRQPIYQWKKDSNLPGWSNAFIFGIGNFQ